MYNNYSLADVEFHLKFISDRWNLYQKETRMKLNKNRKILRVLKYKLMEQTPKDDAV
ncbi:MAG: hypothetical protein IIB73_08385 [Proteobacteria bacterium]|nr:hypothetical protein [Pseudomonadota bacterium]